MGRWWRYKWITFHPSLTITPEQREIQQLKAQIKRVEMEKEILKQAAVLMSEIPGKLSR
ncbi:hypothetical protein MY013_41900 [Escherichia coli]|nr:hypothetical protein MY013_41900 [Escherichia coli]GHO33561.1 hypothetical protein MY014_42050 [Escherichia coli]